MDSFEGKNDSRLAVSSCRAISSSGRWSSFQFWSASKIMSAELNFLESVVFVYFQYLPSYHHIMKAKDLMKLALRISLAEGGMTPRIFLNPYLEISRLSCHQNIKLGYILLSCKFTLTIIMSYQEISVCLEWPRGDVGYLVSSFISSIVGFSASPSRHSGATKWWHHKVQDKRTRFSSTLIPGFSPNQSRDTVMQFCSDICSICTPINPIMVCADANSTQIIMPKQYPRP